MGATNLHFLWTLWRARSLELFPESQLRDLEEPPVSISQDFPPGRLGLFSENTLSSCSPRQPPRLPVYSSHYGSLVTGHMAQLAQMALPCPAPEPGGAGPLSGRLTPCPVCCLQVEQHAHG